MPKLIYTGTFRCFTKAFGCKAVMCHCASQYVSYYMKTICELLHENKHLNTLITITNLSPHHWSVKALGGHVRGDLWCHGNHSHPALVSITHRFRTGTGAYVIIGVLCVPRGQGNLWCEEFLIGFICFDSFPCWSRTREVAVLPFLCLPLHLKLAQVPCVSPGVWPHPNEREMNVVSLH